MPENGRLLVTGGTFGYAAGNDNMIRANNGFVYLIGTSPIVVFKSIATGIMNHIPPPPYDPSGPLDGDGFTQVASFPVSLIRAEAGVPVAMDSTGLIHIIYQTYDIGFSNLPSRVKHVTFDTTTDTFGTSEVVTDINLDGGDTRAPGVKLMNLAVDDNDDLHCTYKNGASIFYQNRINGIGGGVETRSRGAVNPRAGSNWDVLSITVDGVELLAATVFWTGGVGTMSSAIAAAINANTTVPNYTAQGASGLQGHYCFIYATTQGSGPNGFVVLNTLDPPSSNMANHNFVGGGDDMWQNEQLVVYTNTQTNDFNRSATDLIIAHPTSVIAEDRPIILGAPNTAGGGNFIWHGNALDATSFISTLGSVGSKGSLQNFIVDSNRNIHFATLSGSSVLVKTHDYGDSWDTWSSQLGWTDDQPTNKSVAESFALFIGPNDEKILVISVSFGTWPAFILRSLDAVYSIPSIVSAGDQWARFPIGILTHLPVIGGPTGGLHCCGYQHLGIKTRWSNKNMNEPGIWDFYYYADWRLGIIDNGIQVWYDALGDIDFANDPRFNFPFLIDANEVIPLAYGRTITRSDLDFVYIFTTHAVDEEIHVFKSTVAPIPDADDFPKGADVLVGGTDFNAVGCDIAREAEGSTIIHIAYSEIGATNTLIRHVTYDTSTELFGTPETIVDDDELEVLSFHGLVICVDSNDDPHVAYETYRTSGGGPNEVRNCQIMYTNKIGGSWKTPVIVAFTDAPGSTTDSRGNPFDIVCTPPTAAIGTEVPIIAYFLEEGGGGFINHRLVHGNVLDATSFVTSAQSLSTLSINSITVTDSNRIIVQSANSTTVTAFEHDPADDWDTWQSTLMPDITGAQSIAPTTMHEESFLLLAGSSNIFLEQNRNLLSQVDGGWGLASRGTARSPLFPLELSGVSGMASRWSKNGHVSKKNIDLLYRAPAGLGNVNALFYRHLFARENVLPGVIPTETF